MTESALKAARGDRLLRMPEVQTLTKLKKSTLYKLMTAGNFPDAVKLSPRTVAWRLSEVESWIQARTMQADIQLLRLPDVMAITGLSKSMVYALMRANTFPKGLDLTERATAWSESSVRTWVQNLTGNNNDRLLRLPQVLAMTGLGKSTQYSLEDAGKFPAKVHPTDGMAAWSETAVLDWISARPGKKNI